MINKWQEFLQTEYPKENVPNWFDKLQLVVQNQQEPENLIVDQQPENSREEWMVISDLHVPFPSSSPTNVETAYEWNRGRADYSEQQIGEMPM